MLRKDWFPNSVELGLEKALLGVLESMVIVPKEDSWVWSSHKGVPLKLVLLEKRLQHHVVWGKTTDCFCGTLWVPVKVRFFVWRAVDGKIATLVALNSRGMNFANTVCSSCGVGQDSADHILVSCLYAKIVWWHVFVWCGILFPGNLSTINEYLEALETMQVSVVRKKLLHAIVLATGWNLWMACNNKIFKGKATTAYKCVAEIKEIAFLWIKNRSKFHNIEWEKLESFDLGSVIG
jgi:hypothetical protein